MKLTYVYNPETKYFQNVFEAEDGETVENSTELKPEDGLYNPQWDGAKWVGQTLDEFIESNPPDTQTPPTTVDELKLLVGNLVAENAKKDQAIKQLQSMAGTLVAQVAELNKGGK